MNPTATLRRIVAELDGAEIPHMLVGSFASTAHSEPRMTYDIDFVIDPTHEALDRFVSRFDPDTVYIGPDPHRGYLDLWAERIGVRELLERARGGGDLTG